MMTQAQSQALASFVARIRDDWDHAGIVAAIGKSSNLASPAAIGRALCALAENRDLRTPALLSQPGKHWHQDGEQVGANTPSHNVRCPEHPINFHPCPLCAAKRTPPPLDDPEYAQVRAALASRHARAATPTAKTKLTDSESAAIARARLEENR